MCVRSVFSLFCGTPEWTECALTRTAEPNREKKQRRKERKKEKARRLPGGLELVLSPCSVASGLVLAPCPVVLKLQADHDVPAGDVCAQLCAAAWLRSMRPRTNPDR